MEPQRVADPQRLHAAKAFVETVSLTEGTSATNCFAFRAAVTVGQYRSVKPPSP